MVLVFVPNIYKVNHNSFITIIGYWVNILNRYLLNYSLPFSIIETWLSINTEEDDLLTIYGLQEILFSILCLITLHRQEASPQALHQIPAGKCRFCFNMVVYQMCVPFFKQFLCFKNEKSQDCEWEKISSGSSIHQSTKYSHHYNKLLLI